MTRLKDKRQDGLSQVFIEPILFTVRIFEGHNIATLLWALFLYKSSSGVSSKRVQIIIVYDLLFRIFDVFFLFCVCILSIPNVEITTAFTYDFLNNSVLTTFTFVCTHTNKELNKFYLLKYYRSIQFTLNHCIGCRDKIDTHLNIYLECVKYYIVIQQENS